MTTTTAPAAREVTGLAALDEQARDLGTAALRWDAPPAEYTAWTARRDTIAAQVAAVQAQYDGLICRKCDGHGITQWRHRHDGTCYQCKGDGWTTKGRRQITTEGMQR